MYWPVRNASHSKVPLFLWTWVTHCILGIFRKQKKNNDLCGNHFRLPLRPCLSLTYYRDQTMSNSVADRCWSFVHKTFSCKTAFRDHRLTDSRTLFLFRTIFHLIWENISTRGVFKNLCSNREFCENRRCKSHSLRRGVNDFYPYFSVFVGFLKIGAGRLFLWA
jgi:hypothetical protein